MTYDGTEMRMVRKWMDADELASFRLCCVGLDGAQTALDVWPRQLGDVEIAEAIEETAARHTNALGGSHAFVLQAVQADGKTILASHAFRVSAEALPGASVLSSEPANAGGLVAQTMRHNEALMSSTVLAWDKLGRTASSMIERADRRAAKSEEAYMQVVELHQELIERSEERKSEARRQDKMLAIKADSAQKLLALAPVVLDSVVRKVAPEGLDRASANTARALFESLSPEQLSGVLKSLSPEQGAVMLHLFEGLAREAEEKAAAKAAAEAAADNGEDHATH